MQSKLLTLALIEIFLGLTISVVIFFVSFRLLQRLFFKDISIDKEHISFAVFTSGIVLSIGLIIAEIIPSITNMIRLSLSSNNDISTSEIFQYSGLYLLIGFIMAVLINLAVFLLFSAFTKGVNEFKDIQQNNLATAILVTTILLAITLITKESISLLISALVPYPDTTNFLY
ncbi:DUF350 domain-containing protein [Aquimarina brevivitae]|uniref:Uncharacterized protein DUF350 n=1 Tax=Aquimarina brevivitae TaxID=323412 RepID=A0A4Q7PGL1_9FLAO|nr:DUF350 domain-containing protein [Aquimarina brevivitae]RZS99646.1 uncharacterized protein DUF350 [Aquimarina brevivitae]